MPALDYGSGHGITAATAHAEHADAVFVNKILRHQIIDDDGKIGNAVGRVFQTARFAAALALVTRVKGDGYIACAGQTFGVHVAGGLLFARADGMGADDDGVFFGRVKAVGEMPLGADALV